MNIWINILINIPIILINEKFNHLNELYTRIKEVYKEYFITNDEIKIENNIYIINNRYHTWTEENQYILLNEEIFKYNVKLYDNFQINKYVRLLIGYWNK